MKNLKYQKEKLLEILEEKNYLSVRMSIFQSNTREWDTVINYDENEKKYLVYLTMDRASKGQIFEFNNFDDAEKKFIELVERTIMRYNYYIENDMPVPYFSPLWKK